MVILSVRLSVTTQYRFKTRWDSNYRFLPYDSFVSLVFSAKISCCWVKGVPWMRGKRGAPPWKGVILPLLARLTWKWLQIGTDVLLIITSTGDELLRNVNIDDLEWPWTPKIRGLVNFSRFLAVTCISRVNCAEMAADRPRQPAYEIFSMLCRY